MAKVLQSAATAGFEEKNDMLVTAAPGEVGSGIKIELSSPVKRQYGKHMDALIRACVEEAGFSDVVLTIKDRCLGLYDKGARSSRFGKGDER